MADCRKFSGPSEAPRRLSRTFPLLLLWKGAPLAQSGAERKSLDRVVKIVRTLSALRNAYRTRAYLTGSCAAMSIEMIHLRKLLQLFYLPANRQTSKLREDIRNDRDRDGGGAGGGPDFFSGFWADAKGHVFGRADLHDGVRTRVESNPGRGRLYPQLRDGFLRWWNERRRWTNEPFRPAEVPRARFALEGLGTIKIENMLAVRDARDADHFVYPYFCEEPLLSEEGARLGLWLLQRAFPHLAPEELRILDVIRGETFSTDRLPLRGDEEQVLRRRYQALLQRWRELREEY
jgi:hypothetical protein